MYAEREKEKQQRQSAAALRVGLGDGLGSATQVSGRPMADLYHETTIFFADLAGKFMAYPSLHKCNTYILIDVLFAFTN